MEIMANVFKEVDVVVTPATGMLPPKIEADALNGKMVSDLTTVHKKNNFFFLHNPHVVITDFPICPHRQPCREPSNYRTNSI
jgi:hypothetical protein